MPDSFNDILLEVAPLIRSLGFKGSAQNYRKSSDKVVIVINFQKSSGSSSGEQFYVNLGVQPLFVPTEGNSQPDAKTIKEYDCIFRKRINPPQDTPGWPYTSHILADLKARLIDEYQHYLMPLMVVPGPMTEATLQDFPEDENSSNSLLGTRSPRNLFHFARIAKATNQPEKAFAFAQHALENCPEQASKLRASLKNFLAEVEKTLAE